jgi:anti-sigma regulatory factor (Ser/Thr protein kinase)
VRGHAIDGILRTIARDPGVQIPFAPGVEMTNVEQARPLDDTARLPTRVRRSGHVLLAERFVAADLRRIRNRCRAALGCIGLDDERTYTFVAAINECLTNAIRHGGGRRGLILVDEGAVVIAEIIDQGPGLSTPVPKHLPAPDSLGGRGLWMAQQMVDRLTLTTGTSGTTVRLEVAH